MFSNLFGRLCVSAMGTLLLLGCNPDKDDSGDTGSETTTTEPTETTTPPTTPPTTVPTGTTG